MEILLGLALLAVCGLVIFVAEFWWILLILVAISVAVALIILCAYRTKISDVVSAEVIDEKPITERVAENIGYTVGYGRWLSAREHYRYKNVVTGYKVKFVVTLRNGKKEVLTCKKDGITYNALIVKVKK